MFGVGCWLLWTWRNKTLFDVSSNGVAQPAKAVQDWVQNISLAMDMFSRKSLLVKLSLLARTLLPKDGLRPTQMVHSRQIQVMLMQLAFCTTVMADGLVDFPTILVTQRLQKQNYGELSLLFT